MATWTLTEHITKHLTRPRLGDIRPPSLWPSSASAVITNDYGEPEPVGACRRATFFKYMLSSYSYNAAAYKGYETLVDELNNLRCEPDKYMRWIWEAGNLFEAYIIEQAKQSGVYLASQVQVVIPEYNIVGKLDLLVTNPSNQKIVADEVKSIYGHNANSVIGTPGMMAKRTLGSPRDSNLMQAAIYNWHLSNRLSDLEATRLLYGARDTGRYAEFNVTTELNQDGLTAICYAGVSPFVTSKVMTRITIENILEQYKLIHESLEAGVIPTRDYDLQYSEDKIEKLYQRDELSKTNKEAFEKIKARRTENEQRLAEGKEPKKELKLFEKGDFLCSTCEFRRYCYKDDGTVRA